MIELTDLLGRPVYIMKSWIQFVRSPIPGEGVPDGTKTVIALSGLQYFVQQTPEQVRALWNAQSPS